MTRSATDPARTTAPAVTAANASASSNVPAVPPPVDLGVTSRTRSRTSVHPTAPAAQTPASDSQPTLSRQARATRSTAAAAATAAAAVATSRGKARRSRGASAPAPATASGAPETPVSARKPPTTRKRARATSARKALQGPPVAEPSASGSAAVASSSGSAGVSSPSAHRPSKRAKRASIAREHLRTLASTSAPDTATRGRRSSGTMNPSDPTDGSGTPAVNEDEERRVEDGPSSLGSDRAGATTLQGLLRRLGASGLDDMFPSSLGSSHSRLRQLLGTIRNPDNETQQIDALSQLCEYLSVGTEESMVSFSIDLFVSPLIGLLSNASGTTSPDIMLLSARALTHMMDALPSAAASIAHNGAAAPLCANLVSIEYIDLAEQSLSALQKLSVDYPQPIVRAGGFVAALSFIDFFSTGVQRVAATTACNLCRSPPHDAIDMIIGVLPVMMNLLDSGDQRIRESILLGFSRLADAFKGSAEHLEKLCGKDAALVDKVLGLVVPASPPALAPASYSSALRLLATLARGSSLLGAKLLSTSSLILKLRSRLDSGAGLHAVDCLTLADALLPEALESDEAIANMSWRSRRRRSGSSLNSAQAAVDAARREELGKNPAPLSKYGESFFATATRFYVSSADVTARRLTLSILSKFLAIAPQEILISFVGNPVASAGQGDEQSTGIAFCPFVAALLSENSTSHEALAGLSLAISALKKVPDLKQTFVREGVVHELVRLAATAPTSPPGEMTSAASVAGIASASGASGSAAGAPAAMTRAGGREAATSALDGVARSADAEARAAVAAMASSAVESSARVPPAVPGETSLAATHPRTSLRTTGMLRPMVSESTSTNVAKAAKALVREYLGGDANGNVDLQDMKDSLLNQLSQVRNELLAATPAGGSDSGERALDKLAGVLAANDGISVFELSKSHLVGALAEYLRADGLPASVRTTRAVCLVCALNKHSENGPFSLLVKRVLGVFASEEKLPVQANDSSTGSTSVSVSSGLRQLAQPFKLRLRRASAEQGGSDLRDYSHHVVLIEPLATMASVQDFLWPRVKPVEGSAGAGAATGAARAGSSAGRAGDDGNGEAHEVELGSDVEHMDVEGPGADGNSDGGNEEDVDPDEDADDVMIDEDDGGEHDHFDEPLFHMEEEEDEDEIEGHEEEDEHHVENSDEEVSSGEEDVIEQDDEEEDHGHDGPGSFGVDPLGTSLPAFELDYDALAQSPRRPLGSVTTGGESGPASRRRGSSTRGALRHDATSSALRSYAAALAGGLRGSAGPGGSSGTPGGGVGTEASPGGGRQPSGASAIPKLSFSLNGKAIPRECSILSAVIRSNGRGLGVGSRLWSDVHTLTYSKAREPLSSTVDGASTGRASEPTVSAAVDGQPLRRSLRVRGNSPAVVRAENVEAAATVSTPVETVVESEAPSSVLDIVSITDTAVNAPKMLELSAMPGSVANVLSLLGHLRWIHDAMHPRLTLSRESGRTIYLEEDLDVSFMSHKITAKLMRQLSDPLALCAGVVPAWCFLAAREASFLIPFETRRVLFQSTALGVARSLHLLQTRTDTSGVPTSHHRSARAFRDSETRIGRIQRQKVRIHRNRILESAIRVMNMYAGHSTVLEVEYFDEVGTGLGPTLEFYTLASRETQRADLGLWRGEPRRSDGTDNGTVKRKPNADGEKPGGSEAKTRSAAKARRRGRSSSRLSADSCALPRSARYDPDEDVEYIVPTGRGLFPACLPIGTPGRSGEVPSKSIALFTFVGRLMGKALTDGRLLDLRFSKTFCRLLMAYGKVLESRRTSEESAGASESGFTPQTFSVGQAHGGRVAETLDGLDAAKVWESYCSGTSGLAMVRDVDPQLAQSLQSILDMVRSGKGKSVGDLCLSFTVPGDDSMALVANGAEKAVTGDNAEEYLTRVVYHILYGGVRRQTEALLSGLAEVLDIRSLLLFQADELEQLMCGPSYEKWSMEFLVQTTRCDHGFQHESPAVLFLLRLLSELDAEDQRRFVLFATGSPALPLGGLRNLHPRLTIVRRTPENGRSPDECLPTVMTCTNYLKLPDYSSYDIAKERIMYAVREGQGSFHLS